MAIVVGLLGGVLRITHECWVLSRRSMTQAWTRQETVMLGQRWRRFIHRCPSNQWQATEDGKFVAGDRSAQFANQRLVLWDGKERLAELALPRHLTAHFSVEPRPGLRPCAVLTLRWDVKRGPEKDTYSVRLVACRSDSTSESDGERNQP